MIAQIIAIINLIIPTGWEVWNDRKGDFDKTQDVVIRYSLMVMASVINYLWVSGKAVFDSVFLAAGINFMFFDYIIAYILIKRGTIEAPRGTTYHWFTYLSNSPFDKIWKDWDPKVRALIRVVVLGTAIAMYVIER